MFLLPVIPFITDTLELMEKSISKAKDINLDFIIFGGMTLKEGKQKDYFFNVLNKYNSKLIKKYQDIYKGKKWGEATDKYYGLINSRFNKIATKYKMPKRIPLALYKDILSENDLVTVILEHIDYLLKLKGKRSPYGYAAFSISQLKQPLTTMKEELQKIKGVGKTTENIILEILETGTSAYYEKLMML
ncbi:unnamed protein product [marine sediment metagenome]|uniref:Crossover junction endonuclease MUS81-like HHH domain-containing protein n=1 Tax=marine sediment metagenome TaxID=412755 RepID=X1DQ95_9ZZZZ